MNTRFHLAVLLLLVLVFCGGGALVHTSDSTAKLRRHWSPVNGISMSRLHSATSGVEATVLARRLC